MTTPQGKGFFIWQVTRCEGGNAAAIAAAAAEAQLSYALIKIADGTNDSNVDKTTGTDLIPPVVHALKAHGLQAWGWHYIYGDDPTGEAKKAIQRVNTLGLDGYAIDAETQYNQPGTSSAASTFMNRLRSGLSNMPIALCSYRFPSYQPYFPFQTFLEKCDLNMPQVYWLKAHNPGDQLIRCVREYTSLSPSRPILPVGAAFKEGTWAASTAEVTEFLQTAKNLNLSAASFWEWGNCRAYIPSVWQAISSFDWKNSQPNLDVTQQYINALNTRDIRQVLALYASNAVHVTASRTIQGTSNLNLWYTTFFNSLLPNSHFTLTGYSGEGSSRHLTWTATSNRGNVGNGSDTIGLLNGKIAYHYTFFTVS